MNLQKIKSKDDYDDFPSMRVYEQEGELFAGVERNPTSGDGARGILARA